jgi:hypothetical protein
MTTTERQIIGLAHLASMEYLNERMKDRVGLPDEEMKAEAKKIYEKELAKLKKEHGLA